MNVKRKPTAKAAKPIKGKAKKAAKPAKKVATVAPMRKAKESVKPRRSPEALAPFIDLLMVHQIRYLKDRSRYKKLVKSRRIGGTWMQALEDVLDCTETAGLPVWFSSADKSAGIEYLNYVKMWVGVANLLVQAVEIEESELDDVDFDNPEDLEVADEAESTATVVHFHNGSKITILSSNPNGFRSKGGKVVLDEFAHHKRDRELWKAAEPVSAWGHDVRIISTQNGMSTVFYRLGNAKVKPGSRAEAAAQSKYAWSVHTVTIMDAVENGMLDRIEGRVTSKEEREAYIQAIRDKCMNEAQFQEEYMGNAQDEAHALLPYALIESVEREGILGLSRTTGPLYLGMDIARKKDLTVIYVLELCGMVLHTRHLVVMEKQSFSTQKKTLWPLLNNPRLVRASIDATGIGMQLSEEAQETFGTYKIEAVTFTAAIKDALATRTVQEFEDSGTLIPVDPLQKEGLHAVARTVSLTNKVRYDAKHDEENGHGDHFWALALAIAAARTGDNSPAEVISSSRTESGGTSPFSSFGSLNYNSLDTWANVG